MTWDELPQEAIRKSIIVSFRKRLRACVNAKGWQFKLTLLHGLVNLVIDVSVLKCLSTHLLHGNPQYAQFPLKQCTDGQKVRSKINHVVSL